jgi:tripartite-type tricarboxylate transporter receptor subunit TctC
MEVVRSAADGYTVLVGSLGTHVLRPLLVKDCAYHTLRDLTPITRLVDVSGVILAAPDLPASNLRELIELLRVPYSTSPPWSTASRRSAPTSSPTRQHNLATTCARISRAGRR